MEDEDKRYQIINKLIKIMWKKYLKWKWKMNKGYQIINKLIKIMWKKIFKIKMEDEDKRVSNY